MLIGFVCWNRLGLTAKNLEALLKTEEDFDLYIIDNNSKDDTWEYLKNIKDSRIKEIKKLDNNRGLIYAMNYVLSKRKKGQDFMNIDQDVEIVTKDWISNNKAMVREFPEIGILGNVRPTYFQEYPKVKNKIIERNNLKFIRTDFIMGCNMFFPGSIMDKIGYCNETGYGDSELNHRIKKLDKWVGYCADNIILSTQRIDCSNCLAKNVCRDSDNEICFSLYSDAYSHTNTELAQIKHENRKKWKFTKDNIYCGSIHDKESQTKGYYNETDANRIFNWFKKRD
ncbi:glycosyltransferase family 2 protein [bacterium]|nr:glycosyltransferase family 2 protein [bacterium]